MNDGEIDSRAWLIWGLAAVVPLLVARNPYVVTVVLGCTMIVRHMWSSHHRQGWGWIVRLAIIFMATGVIFNTLTVHSGNQVLFTLPDRLPLVGGAMTLNAVVYGIVSGVAIVTLVLTGTTVASGLVWSDLMRSLPPRIAPLAVAGSVAWGFLPGSSRAFGQIRESQAVRGHRVRGVRDLPPLIVPLLGGALEQAMTMSEALESRGFGATREERSPSMLARIMLACGVTAFLVVAYAAAVGQTMVAGVAMIAGLLLVAVAFRRSDPGQRTTRYRPSGWDETDILVTVLSLCSLAVFVWRSRMYPDATLFNPYPDIHWPDYDVILLAGLVLLVAPAFLTPTPGGHG